MSTGMNIQILRNLNKLSQKDLGIKLNVSNKTISSWEKDRTEPSIDMINAMCKIFNCSAEEITEAVHMDYITENKMGYNSENSENHDISEFEHGIIEAFRTADAFDQTAVLRILGLEKREASSESKIS